MLSIDNRRLSVMNKELSVVCCSLAEHELQLSREPHAGLLTDLYTYVGPQVCFILLEVQTGEPNTASFRLTESRQENQPAFRPCVGDRDPFVRNKQRSVQTITAGLLTAMPQFAAIMRQMKGKRSGLHVRLLDRVRLKFAVQAAARAD